MSPRLILLAFPIFSSSLSAFPTPDFRILPPSPQYWGASEQGWSEDISADGRIVAGGSPGFGGAGWSFGVAASWTPTSTANWLFHNDWGTNQYSRATGVSSDGTYFAGLRNTGWENSPSKARTRAFRWSQSTGLFNIPEPFVLGDTAENRASGISADGSIVIGNGNTPTVGSMAWRWSSSTGTVIIEGLDGSAIHTSAEAISNQGDVIVGSSRNNLGRGEAFRRTKSGGIMGLGFLPGGNYSGAYGISGDGTMIVGQSDSSGNNPKAFLWTQVNGMIDLGDLPGAAVYSFAKDVSNTGIVVGQGVTESGYEPFIWDELNGMRNLNAFITNELAITIPNGYELTDVTAISDDGLYLTGNARNIAAGYNEPWRLVAPEPSAAALLGMMLFFTRRRR